MALALVLSPGYNVLLFEAFHGELLLMVQTVIQSQLFRMSSSVAISKRALTHHTPDTFLGMAL